MVSPKQFDPRDLNKWGQNLRQVCFSMRGILGGTLGHVNRSGFCAAFGAPVWLIGLQLSGSICANTARFRFLGVGIDIGAGSFAPDGMTNMFLFFTHLLGSTSTLDLPASKGGAMFFQWPFLPYIPSGQRLAGYVSEDLQPGEEIGGIVTAYYVYYS